MTTTARHAATPRHWLRAAVPAATLALVAGCSSPPSPLDLVPEPGELDYDIAVNRVTVYEGAISEDLQFNPWTSEALDADGEVAVDAVSQELVDEGLTFMCGYLTGEEDGAADDPTTALYVSVVAQEAVNAAVVASASPEFREASGVTFAVDSALAASDEAAFQELSEATRTLATDLSDEWVELYALQEQLSIDALTVDGAQQAHAAMARRCDVTLGDEDVMTEPATPVQAWILAPPAIPGEDASG